LQYEVIKMGDGDKPLATDEVTVHYHGTTTDSKVFDSSKDRGEPATFPLNGVIAGWTEALQLMPKGSIFKLYLPSNLAYGERGAGEKIPPHAVLIFEVELLDIKKK
ncbi:MAG: FKBP-type peptidyl-prolyl cis-trans isomerase, partial [Bacteroidota bacterium]